MELITERLILRTVEQRDVKEVARMWDFERGPIPEEEAGRVLERMAENHRKNRPGRIYHLCLGVAEKSAPETIIGWCGLDGTSEDKLHIFYSIEPEHRSRGYATEAARALLNYAFQDAGAAFVNGGCYQENQASYRVMEKAGMLPAGSEENGAPLFYLDRETYLKKQELTQ